MKVCIKCGTVQNDGHTTCVECGAVLPKPLDENESKAQLSKQAVKVETLTEGTEVFYVSLPAKITAALRGGKILSCVFSLLMQTCVNDGRWISSAYVLANS